MPLRVGQRVRFVRSVRFTEEALIEKGETGVVELADPTIGQTHIRLERNHPELACCNNSVWIIPPDTEVAEAITVIHDAILKRAAVIVTAGWGMFHPGAIKGLTQAACAALVSPLSMGLNWIIIAIDDVPDLVQMAQHAWHTAGVERAATIVAMLM